ncbi:MAG: polyprenol monophosphomannose synthase, partial [Rhizobiales bacterium]|nr:polyprenol monophosphomannose synthase [Hyphomicrobiales bacterium]
MTETGTIVVVIPTYNERDNIQRLVPEVLAVDPAISVVIVDDNSPDGTGATADVLAAANPGRIDVLHRGEKNGIGPAYIAGFQHALTRQPRLVAQMDADRSHQPDDLRKLIEAASDADLVLGSRYVPGGATRGWPIHRRLMSQFGGLYARLILGVHVRDMTGGFKVYRASTLSSLDIGSLQSDGYVFQIETTFRAIKRGFRVVEVPITFVDRVAGKSKLSRGIVIEAMLRVWRL